MDKKYYLLGVLLVTVLASAIVIQFNKDAKIKVTEDYSKFYSFIDSKWLVSGTEYNKLFDGTTQVYRYASQVKVWKEVEDNSITIYRHTPYRRVGCNITDEYKFDGDADDIELFPIYHKLIFKGCKDLFYRYQVEDLIYNGITEYGAKSPQHFGNKMVVEWDDYHNWAHVYQNGKLKVQWKIPLDYYELQVRLFDPAQNSSNITLHHNISAVYWDVNVSLFNISSMQITQYNITPLNQTIDLPLFYYHNNGTESSYQVQMALNNTPPDNHTYKCGLSPYDIVPINETKRNLNNSLLNDTITWSIWCYLDLVGANSSAMRAFNISGSYE